MLQKQGFKDYEKTDSPDNIMCLYIYMKMFLMKSLVNVSDIGF